MASWRRGSAGGPEHLTRFCVLDWPGAHCTRDAIRRWEQACLAWLDESEARALPFGEYGDFIDVLSTGIRLDRTAPSCPEEHGIASSGLRD